MSVDYAAIREITIKNFRCIDDLHLSFLNPQGDPTRVVVLAGPNGCGKTSVLEAILLAFGSDQGPLGSEMARRSIQVGHEDFLIEFDLMIKGGYITITRSMETPPFDPSDELDVVYYKSYRVPGPMGAVHITSGFSDLGTSDGGRVSPAAIKQLLVDARAHELFATHKAGVNVSWYSDRIEAINLAWQRYYPGQRFAVQSVGSSPALGFDVLLDRGAHEPPLSIDLLSSGQIELFTFIGSLATNEPAPGLILIDEPELHLDPQWHRIVLQTLLDLRPLSQIIVATHSPEIYESVASYERHFLVPHDDPRAKLWQPVLADAGAAP